MLKTISSEISDDYNDYLYGVTNPHVKEFFEEKLEEYLHNLELKYLNMVNDDQNIEVFFC